VNLTQNKQFFFLTNLIAVIFYFLLSNFGFTDAQNKTNYLILFIIFLICSLRNNTSVFLILNIGVATYFQLINSYDFSIMFFQIFFCCIFIGDIKIIDSFIVKFKKIVNFELGTYSAILLLFVGTLMTQNKFLQYEIIDFDVSTFLVMARELSDGYLPYERQWESHPPLLHIFNYLILNISNHNFLIYKILFDIFTFSSTALIYFLAVKRFKLNSWKSLATCFLFLLFLSQPWASVEYSEAMSLSFLVAAYYLLLGDNTTSFFLTGILFGISTLINTGVIIFFVAFILGISLNKNVVFKKSFLQFSAGLSIIHLIMFLVYFFKGLGSIYIATLIKVPLGYAGTDDYFFYSLRVFFESIYTTNSLLGMSFFILLFSNIKLFISTLVDKNLKVNLVNHIAFLSLSVLFIYLPGKGYYHHFYYFLFFISITLLFLDSQIIKVGLSTVTIFLVFLYAIPLFTSSFTNLLNSNEIYSSYPTRSIAFEIEKNFKDSDFKILAIDNLLLAFYLNKPTETYITHPTNHGDEYLIEILSKGTNKLSSNYLDLAIESKPDVISCSVNENWTDYYEFTESTIFKCENLKKEAYELISLSQDLGKKGNYYFNPSKYGQVFLKISN
jgi:hypothetical protein